ncbi:MAG: hypothetical protein IAG13_10630, partial [Deltaproteobacteria bacterium]|nr:hypothetical protein [Nannocystaceae bacterium]
FNVAVCHHALLLAAAEGTPEQGAQRSAAVKAYRAYLDAAPEATDRADVERIIVELGGEPSTTTDTPQPGWDDESPALPELREIVTRIDPDPVPPIVAPPVAPPPSPPPPPRRKVHGRVGPFVPVVLAHIGRLGDTGRVVVAPMLGIGLRGGAFLGARERVNLGGELSAYAMPSASRSRHTLAGGALVATLEYGDTVGRARRFLIAGGIVVGPALESLRREGGSDLQCSIDQKDEASQRAGLLLGARLVLAALLGRRRNHELALRITPALGAFGPGSSTPPNGGGGCDRTPFAEVGLPRGAALVTTIDLGYAPRL